jgi:hypothetical protein
VAVPISKLLRSVEAGRLRERFGLGRTGDQAAREAELQRRAPWHPTALTLRAREALPETLLGPPPAHLREAALAFQRGRPELALELARAASGPWADVLVGDLSLLLGDPSQARLAYDRALDGLGPLADLLARVGRAQLEQGRHDQAWATAADSLVLNPLLGSARQLLEDAASAAGVPTLRLPLRAPVKRTGGRMEATRRLSPRASAAWSAWNRAASSPEAAALPPGSVPHAALLQAWTRTEGRAPRYREHDDLELHTLLRWQEQGLIAAYEWSTGLNPANASAYNEERRKAEKTLRRFWLEGLKA